MLSPKVQQILAEMSEFSAIASSLVSRLSESSGQGPEPGKPESDSESNLSDVDLINAAKKHSDCLADKLAEMKQLVHELEAEIAERDSASFTAEEQSEFEKVFIEQLMKQKFVEIWQFYDQAYFDNLHRNIQIVVARCLINACSIRELPVTTLWHNIIEGIGDE